MTRKRKRQKSNRPRKKTLRKSRRGRDASDRYNDGIKKVEKELSDYKKSKEELAEKLADELVAGVLNGCC